MCASLGKLLGLCDWKKGLVLAAEASIKGKKCQVVRSDDGENVCGEKGRIRVNLLAKPAKDDASP